ncbi:MAG: hypothetical protein ACFFE8_07620 [Candidatus Heimdallarchaeota archaeon]
MNATDEEVPPNIRSVIDQLVRQQFFLTPNYIIDRTSRNRLEVEGSNEILAFFSEFLFRKMKDLDGTDPKPYISALFSVIDKLQLEKGDLISRFERKAGSFLIEGLASETILVITTVSTILESLDAKHFETLMKNLRSSFLKVARYRNLEELFDEGIKRLGETANPDFSLLLNLVKIKDLARLFGGVIQLKPQEEERIRNRIIQELLSRD